MHDFEYQITNSIFVSRYLIFRLPLFFVLLGLKTSFGIRKLTEYQILISKLTLNARFCITNYHFDIRSSVFDIRTAAVFRLNRVKKPSLAFEKLPNIKVFYIKTKFNARF